MAAPRRAPARARPNLPRHSHSNSSRRSSPRSAIPLTKSRPPLTPLTTIPQESTRPTSAARNPLANSPRRGPLSHTRRSPITPSRRATIRPITRRRAPFPAHRCRLYRRQYRAHPLQSERPTRPRPLAHRLLARRRAARPHSDRSLRNPCRRLHPARLHPARPRAGAAPAWGAASLPVSLALWC